MRQRFTELWGRRSWRRGLQVGGLALALLCGTGGTWLTLGQQTVTAAPAAERPELTFLVAGRDVAYCGYHLRCKDQTQRENLFQDINTDTLMLVRVSGPRVEVLNIPRDTNVGEYDPRQSAASQKVNSQYWQGGPQALEHAVEQITGTPVDFYVILNEDYVAELIDALGGLTVTVPEGGIQWQDQAAGIDLNLPPGEQHLSGRDAALYLRVRKGVGDDWGRIDHQKQALTQLLGRLRSPQGLRVLPTLISGFGKNIETNLNPDRLAALVPYLSELNLTFATLPTQSIPGTFNLAPDPEALRRVWPAAAGAEAEEAPADGESPAAPALPLAEQSLVIYDGSGALLGPALARALREVGYQNIRVELAADPVAASQVLTLDAPGPASEVAGLLGLPRLQGERFDLQENEVAVLLGTDAPQALASLLPLRRPTDGRALGLTPHDTAALLEESP